MDDKLNILILTLSTGEEVIANLKDHIEKRDGVDQKVCYNMVYPFVLTRSGPIKEERVGVLFTPWKFFSSDTSFLIGFDQVINVCTPLQNIIEEYKRSVNEMIKAQARQIK